MELKIVITVLIINWNALFVLSLGETTPQYGGIGGNIYDIGEGNFAFMEGYACPHAVHTTAFFQDYDCY